MAWYVAPREGRMKVDPNGPQPRIHGHGQDHELQRGLGWVGCGCNKGQGHLKVLKQDFKCMFVGGVCICRKLFVHLAVFMQQLMFG